MSDCAMTVATMPGLAVVRSLNRAQSADDHSCQPSAVSAGKICSRVSK
jgi:hypothetical protein